MEELYEDQLYDDAAGLDCGASSSSSDDDEDSPASAMVSPASRRASAPATGGLVSEPGLHSAASHLAYSRVGVRVNGRLALGRLRSHKWGSRPRRQFRKGAS